jgi:hypothetical protein
MATSTIQTRVNHPTLKLNSSEPQSPLPLILESFDLPAGNQRELGAPHPTGTVTPLALRPLTTQDDEEPSLDTIIETIKSLQADGEEILTKKLARYRALLF